MVTIKEIHIAAALIVRSDGRVLLVRKRGTAAFMQPGGKIERGEKPIAALCRELQEELNVRVSASAPEYIGKFAAPAVNEPGWTVVAEIFRVHISEPVSPAAEIAEIIWFQPGQDKELNLAPLTKDHVLPLLNPV